MKPIFYCLFSLCSFFFSADIQAQSFSVKWGDNSKLKYDFDDAVPVSNGKYIILKLEAKRAGMFSGTPKLTPTIVLVGPDMDQISEQEIPIEEKNAVLKGFEKYGNNIFFMYTAYESSTKTTTFYAIKISEKLEIISKTTLGIFQSDSKGDQATPTYKISNDSSKVLLFVEGPDKRKENERYFIGVFNTDLKTIWSRDVEIPIQQRYVSIYDMDVTNDGKVYVAIKHYEKEVSRESVREDGDKIPSYVYKMLVYKDGTAKNDELVFNFNNQFIQGTRLINAADGSVIVAGLYKRKSNGNINGSFYVKLTGGTGEVKNPKMIEFPIELITLVDKDNYASDKSKDPGLYPNFKIRSILTRSNGSIDLVAEYYKLVISTYTDARGGYSRTTYNYYYGDIVNTNIDVNGKAVFTRIPKNQKMTNSNLFLGIFSFVENDKLIILYNDDEDNIERDLEKKPDDVMNFKKSVFAAATIDSKGNLSRQAIYSHRDESYITIPTNTTRISPTKFLIVSDLIKVFKRRTRFGLMILK